MNSRLDLLQPYPFARLKELLSGVEANPSMAPIRLSIGEPKHPAPQPVLHALANSLDGVSKYPATSGSDTLRKSIADWLAGRFKLSHICAATQVLPVNGTREGLFALAQALVGDNSTGEQKADKPRVLMPNPFYQIYEGAAFLAGAEPVFFGLDSSTNQPDFDDLSEQDWQSCQLMYLCTPGNPTGQSLPMAQLKMLVEKAQRYNFVLVSDECYSELYLDESRPCAGLLQACDELGIDDYRNCLVFHSLSKRSNLPGLRSGFTAGDAALIAKFLLYRTYHGSAMPLHHQEASAVAWGDEQHVKINRQLYRAKYSAVMPILAKQFEFIAPDSGFYLWLQTPIDDQTFARELYRQQNLLVVPGSFLARESYGVNPGQNRVRLALVSELDECIEAADRLCAFAATLSSSSPAGSPSTPSARCK